MLASGFLPAQSLYLATAGVIAFCTAPPCCATPLTLTLVSASVVRAWLALGLG